MLRKTNIYQSIFLIIMAIFIFQDIATADIAAFSCLRKPMAFGEAKDRAVASGNSYLSEDERNQLIGTFFDNGEVLDFKFGEDGNVNDVALLKAEGGKVTIIGPGMLEKTHPHIYKNIGRLRQRAESSRKSSLKYVIPEGRPNHFIANDVWFVVSAKGSLSNNNPYFEYEGKRVFATNFGAIPILPFRLLEGGFDGFNDMEEKYILEQAMLHEINAIYCYSIGYEAEDSHRIGRGLEEWSTETGIESGELDSDKYLISAVINSDGAMEGINIESVLSSFIGRYGISDTGPFVGARRDEKNGHDYMKLNATDKSSAIEISFSFREDEESDSLFICNIGTRVFKMSLSKTGAFQMLNNQTMPLDESALNAFKIDLSNTEVFQVLNNQARPLDAPMSIAVKIFFNMINAEIDRFKETVDRHEEPGYMLSAHNQDFKIDILAVSIEGPVIDNRPMFNEKWLTINFSGAGRRKIARNEEVITHAEYDPNRNIRVYRNRMSTKYIPGSPGVTSVVNAKSMQSFEFLFHLLYMLSIFREDEFLPENRAETEKAFRERGVDDFLPKKDYARDVEAVARRDFVRISAAAAAMPKGSMDANSQVQGKTSFLGFIQERMGELYDIDKRSLAAEVLISNANRNPELKQALIAFLINEIERSSKQEAGRIFFGSMLSRLLAGDDSFKILTSLFRHSIDYKTRVKAIHLIGQIFMVNTENPDFQVNPQDMPEFIKAIVNPDMHYSAVFILAETARKNEKIKNELINNFVINMESSQAQGDIESRARLSAALGHIASAQDIFDLLGEGFNPRLIKYLAKDRKGELNGIGMDTRDICPIGMRRLDTIDASMQILEALGIYDSDLVVGEVINLYIEAAALGEQELSARMLNYLMRVLSRKGGVKVFLSGCQRNQFNGLVFKNIEMLNIMAIALEQDGEVFKDIRVVNLKSYPSAVNVEAELQDNELTPRFIEPIVSLMDNPKARDNALKVLSALKIEGPYALEMIEDSKKTVKNKKITQDFFRDVLKVIRNPGQKLSISERPGMPYDEKNVRKYVEIVLGRDNLSMTDAYKYADIGLDVGMFELFDFLESPEYKDYQPDLIKAISSANDLSAVQNNPRVIKIFIDALGNENLRKASATVLAAIQINSPRLKYELIKKVLGLKRSINIEGQGQISAQVDRILEGKTGREYLQQLTELLAIDNYGIQKEALKRLAEAGINSNHFHSQQLSKYLTYIYNSFAGDPETRDYIVKILKTAGVSDRDISDYVKSRSPDKGKKKEIISKGEGLLDDIINRHGSIDDFLRIAQEPGDYDLRHEAFAILSQSNNLNEAFLNNPRALEVVAEELGGGMKDIANSILQKVTHPGLKPVVLYFMITKMPGLFNIQQFLDILGEYGETNSGLKFKIFQLIGGAKGIKSGQITLPVIQLLVRELYNPAARDLSSRMLKAITIQDLNSRRFLLEALISDKILADIKGDTAMGNLSMSIIGVFSRNDILEIEKMSIDPKVRIEAGRILARGLDRGDLLGLGFLRRHSNRSVNGGQYCSSEGSTFIFSTKLEE